MMHWTDVRSVSDLKTFQIDFRSLSDEQKQDIITSMLLQLAVWREVDAQQELFEKKKRRQVAKSAVLIAAPTGIRARRPRS